MSQPVIQTKAPGKLFIAGEYAVVEPGQLAVVVAVDSYITVTLRPAADYGTLSSAHHEPPATWWRQPETNALNSSEPISRHVRAAIETSERLAVELGRDLDYYDLATSSELVTDDGRKLGLGSSAAVSVAVTRALNQYYELGLDELGIFKLALLAGATVNPRASGGDLAAAVFGGWLAYAAPDRDELARQMQTTPLAELLAADWPGLSLRHLPPPAGLELAVGWTGRPAATERMVGQLRGAWRDSDDYAAFLSDSQRCVEELVAGLAAQQPTLVMAAISACRELLRRLAEQAAINIETRALAQLCSDAEAVGAAAKSSGAGGGDCGIALMPSGVSVAYLQAQWRQHGIRPLALKVPQPEGNVDVR
ncbi:MAG: phosphomevalonate kinase [Arachnia propionica]|nr:MAG: phosphomevalonate kinase [Arachnia propionica]